jgi:tRNA (cytidine/uridine-2'-O-)-methyltransferase
MHVVLYEPEIPPNTGNVARLCAATGIQLHLVGRLGFRMDDRHLRRAGLDYWPHVQWTRHRSLEELYHLAGPEARFYYLSKTGQEPYTRPAYRWEDFLVFGSETSGLPRELIEKNSRRVLTIPMFGPVRSLNLSTSVGIVVYEALRQIKGF